MLVYLPAQSCVRVHVRFRTVNFAGMRSTTLAVGLVLRNAADAVQLFNMMRILPRSVGERKLLVSGRLVLWLEYPQIASGTLDGIF